MIEIIWFRKQWTKFDQKEIAYDDFSIKRFSI